MMLVDHTQTSQGFSGGSSVGVREAKASGGDEPGVHIRVAGAPCYEDHQVTPKSALGVVLPVKKLWRIHNSNAFQAEYQQLRKAGFCETDSADPSIVSHLEQGKNQGKCLCEELIKDRKVLR